MKQVHGSEIADLDGMVITADRHVVPGVDGLVTTRRDLVLAAYGADCGMLAFWDGRLTGICHAGWRGLVDGLVEKMASRFDPQVRCHVGPVLHSFEIKKDECYERIVSRFGGRHLSLDGERIIFDFRGALSESLSGVPHDFDPRSTQDDVTLASSRIRPRPKPMPHNRLAIWYDNAGIVRTRVFEPKTPLSIA